MSSMAWAAPSERLVERALALIVASEIAVEDKATQQALSQWQQRSPEHDAALLEARRRWDALAGMAPDLRAHFDEPEAAHMPHMPSAARRRQRRTLLLSIAGLLGGGLVAGRGLQWYWQQPIFQAAYSTRTAQMLKVALADGADGTAGSQLDLAPQSAITVSLFRQRRSIDMARGEVRFDVARNAQRPFLVRTRGASIEVVGTVFTVRDRGGAITVGVEQGLVRVQVLAGPDAASAQTIQLRPGELLDVQDGRATAVRLGNTRALSAWREGWLEFENTPLPEALATVNSYRNRPIAYEDARLHALRLSGRFRSNDSAGLLAALPSILPVISVPQPDGGVELRMR